MAREVFKLLCDMDMLEHPIHRHCFVGGEEEYKQWSTTLPSCYFSISPVTVKDPRSMYALSSLDGRKRFCSKQTPHIWLTTPGTLLKLLRRLLGL